ncbi:UPF0721 transmembrane protein YunE [Thalassobacillus devorans]|uniref:Probable membrane transporter protein n=1 Tax=Thalassobacillus devorans TaxID=279813 RepID=A0ABQ1P349_9BACI|nr:sulfite exporter TauE/SafE family protein [Thalassobacillus devorans]NIK28213.1 hypothetical protein [Thalassobacillus devorans]GGC88013.1 UPF0721 transmembrane protein YunE [Thalassobacillus devorans]
MVYLILILIGFIGGAIGSLAGLGGGIVIVPSLLFLGDSTNLLPPITPQLAVGTSIIIIIFTGLSSTLAYLKRKKVDYVSGLIFFIGGGPGALLGAFLNERLNNDFFNLFFGLLMIVISIVLAITNKLRVFKLKKGLERIYKDNDGNAITYRVHIPIGISFSFLVGILSGLFGIGGGALMVPLMLIVFRFPPSIAVATSMLLVLLFAATGSIAHMVQGNVEWLYTAALIPGAWIGARFGVWISTRLNEKTIVIIFRLFIFLVGVRLILLSI